MTDLDETRDTVPVDFGKYNGHAPDDISHDDPGYIVWLFEETDRDCVSRALYLACKEMLD